MKQLAILCDGNKEIGAGHFFRCLAIAEDLKKGNCRPLFFIDGDSLYSLLKKYQFECTIIENLFFDSNVEVVSEKLREKKIHTILMDSHRASYKYIYELKKENKIIYIDDIPQYAYPVDAIINGHIYASVDEYMQLYKKQLSPPTFLVGTQYFPLRFKGKGSCKNRNGYLFMAGGSDPDHVTVKFLEYIRENRIIMDDQMNIIVGKMNQDYKLVMQLCEQIPWAKCVFGKSDINEEMKSCKLAISASGISLYELASMGTPVIAYTMVDNQKPVAKAMSKIGGCVYVGDSRYDNIFEQIINIIQNISDNELSEISSMGLDLFDGLGSQRIAEFIYNSL